jgi:phosphonate transport system substrate-binding protein
MSVSPETPPLRFGMPASLNVSETDPRMERLSHFLETALRGPVSIVVAKGYQDLAKRMQLGELDVAWAPPFVAARLEVLGFRVLLRGVRGGTSTYRSALISATRGLTVEDCRGKRAVWVDQDSVSGYLLPMAFLRAKGLNPSKDFVSQEFTGSFVASVEKVVGGGADITGVFAPPEGGRSKGATGLDEMAPQFASRVHVIAYTEEVPNSGLVTSSRLPAATATALTAAMQALNGRPDGAWLLSQIFGMEAFEPAPKLGYRALYKLAVATVW